ncbi:hypothetical protein [Streptomyces chumphonensis]|uniref:hypothetical protein n=1 Tax=Streptomyces chumphonensis TaxID=1214925 RepID=UPI003D74A5B4
MTVLRHSVSVLALRPDRLWRLTTPLLDFVESTRVRGDEIVLDDGRPVPDLRLVEGRHLRPGARYASVKADAEDQMTVVVRAWQRRKAIVAEQTVSSDDMTVRLSIRLDTPDRPRRLDVDGWANGPEGSGPLRRGSGRARLDLTAWWAAADLPPGTPPPPRAPATVRLKHRLATARLDLRPRYEDGGRWRVDVSAAVRGRWLLRPVVAVALMVAGSRVRRGFRTAVEQAAEAWDRSVGELLALSPDALRAELAKQATDPTPAKPTDAARGETRTGGPAA